MPEFGGDDMVVNEPWYAYRDSEGLHPGVPPWFEEGDVRGGEWDLETGEFMLDPDVDKWREMDMRSLAGTVYADKVRE